MNSGDLLRQFKAGPIRRPRAGQTNPEMARSNPGSFPKPTLMRLSHTAEQPAAVRNGEALSKLSLENDLLRDRLNTMANLIRKAMPLHWTYQAPSFNCAVKNALQWESRARELLDKVDSLID